MITDFKIFESEIKFNLNSYCVIYGNKSKVTDVIRLLIPIIGKYTILELIDSLSWYDDFMGVFIFYEKEDGEDKASYWVFNDDTEKIRCITENKGSKFIGELKIENGNLILDKFESDANTYNL